MNQLTAAGIVLKLATTMRGKGSWMGETHIQKATYFLQTMLEVPLGFEFILYKHGPFSFDFRDFLAYMESEEFISWRAQPPYGPSLSRGEMAESLLDQYGEKIAVYEQHITFVSEWLSTKNVAELERIATALYVTIDEPAPENRRAAKIVALKPHITSAQSEAAIRELDQMKFAYAETFKI